MVTRLEQTSRREVGKWLICMAWISTGKPFGLCAAFSAGHGWLSVSEFSGDGQVMSPSVRDSNGKEQPNVVMVGGWKLAYDNGSASLQDILGGSKDAKLKAWAANAKCVAKSDGTWNF